MFMFGAYLTHLISQHCMTHTYFLVGLFSPLTPKQLSQTAESCSKNTDCVCISEIFGSLLTLQCFYFLEFNMFAKQLWANVSGSILTLRCLWHSSCGCSALGTVNRKQTPWEWIQTQSQDLLKAVCVAIYCRCPLGPFYVQFHCTLTVSV